MIVVEGFRETISAIMLFLDLFEIRALNYFWGHLQMMFNFPEIVPRNVYDCGSRDHEGELYVIIFLDIGV